LLLLMRSLRRQRRALSEAPRYQDRRQFAARLIRCWPPGTTAEPEASPHPISRLPLLPFVAEQGVSNWRPGNCRFIGIFHRPVAARLQHPAPPAPDRDPLHLAV